jgi:hypothetical protein
MIKIYRFGKFVNQVVNFIMQERNLSYKDALNYLESKYCNN